MTCDDQVDRGQGVHREELAGCGWIKRRSRSESDDPCRDDNAVERAMLLDGHIHRRGELRPGRTDDSRACHLEEGGDARAKPTARASDQDNGTLEIGHAVDASR